MSEHDEDGYAGPATLVVDDAELAVEVDLRGYFQPIDGYYHWYGRVAVSPELASAVGGRKKPCTIRVGALTASGQLSDPDPWGRYRITGTSTPPFSVPKTLAEVEAATA
ncbi:DUF4873 domain-containing protein [Amycolatopsis sp. FDAARGOS 1241]|uniref:DUF4873 domain-containing protein n=1 Tax=Amycolatopsis sp. FDAARGOS 1241 TaxID=2778070 RepID=UPI00195282EA|nr:DUF4873 domain-containing protein [Amycolatopsis sp. FDAARGOS 1241]QRP45041.1 DUF4873 domain-containing protein [Amycolatopsis sp. FDAARGOS 1241]